METSIGTVHPLPSVEASPDHGRLRAALFADPTDDERDELIEYLAWYRTRKRSIHGGGT